MTPRGVGSGGGGMGTIAPHSPLYQDLAQIEKRSKSLNKDAIYYCWPPQIFGPSTASDVANMELRATNFSLTSLQSNSSILMACNNVSD